MADEIGKGSRVRIVSGNDEGVRGFIFWQGPNKFGSGSRFGVKDANGDAFWVDSEEVAIDEDAEQPEKKEATGDVFDKGDRVKIIAGESEGHAGEVFWTGDSRFGPGMRFGVRGDDGETYWADQGEVVADEK